MTRPQTIPARAGLGLRPEHYDEILQTRPDIGWFEIHAENYMGAGGPPHHYLGRIREHYPISLHGVGLSIGGAEPLDAAHLARLATVAERYAPGLFSEHLAWSSHDGVYRPDLLPLPYTSATLAQVAEHIDRVQQHMGRQMLLENPSRYLAFADADLGELEFLTELVARTGCGLLLDVNNVFISASNLGTSAEAYLDAFPLDAVGEIHLAGHAEDTDEDGAPLLIDTHDRPVADPVWALYARVIARAGPRPTLIEWDAAVPSLARLVTEAKAAEAVMARAAKAVSSHAA